MTTETPELPTWSEAAHEIGRGGEFGPLVQFIYDNEPTGADANGFRTGLASVLRQAVAEALAGREGAAEPKLLGWRTADHLMETSEIDQARNWQNHYELHPVFEGDPYTKLAAHPAAQPAPAEPVADGSYVTIHIDHHDRLECCVRMLEIIAVGDSDDPVAEAKQELVAHGFWNDTPAESAAPSAPAPAQGERERLVAECHELVSDAVSAAESVGHSMAGAGTLAFARETRQELDGAIDRLAALAAEMKRQRDQAFEQISELADVQRGIDAACAALAVQPGSERVAAVKYVPVDSKPRDKNGCHPNDSEPRTAACLAALDERGDGNGQGLDGYWKWGFAAGFNAALAVQPAAPADVLEEAMRRADGQAIAHASHQQQLMGRAAQSVLNITRDRANAARAELRDFLAKHLSAQPAAAPEQEANTARLDWLLRQVTGKELRRIGVHTNGDPLVTIRELDAAMAAQHQGGRPWMSAR